MQTQMDAMDHTRPKHHPKPNTNTIHQPTTIQRIQKPNTKKTKPKKHKNKYKNQLKEKKILTKHETQLKYLKNLDF